jgi:hypothetical protein
MSCFGLDSGYNYGVPPLTGTACRAENTRNGRADTSRA